MIAVGNDYNFNFTTLHADECNLDLEYSEEGTFLKGAWVTTRKLNGDEGTGGVSALTIMEYPIENAYSCNFQH